MDLDLGLLIVHSWSGFIDCSFLTWVHWLSILDLSLLIVHSWPGSIDCPFLTWVYFKNEQSINPDQEWTINRPRSRMDNQWTQVNNGQSIELSILDLGLLIVHYWPGSIDCLFLTWVYWLSILDLGLLIVHSWPGSIDCPLLTWVYWLSILDLGLLIVHCWPGSIDCPFLTWVSWLNNQ
jgi:hypothetical protein